MNYYIGIDGGGTKTFIRIMDENEKTIDTHVTLGSNISSIGYEATEKVINNGINRILGRNQLSIKNCIGLCMGAAGVDREKEKKEVENILVKMGFRSTLVMNDTRIVLKTVTDERRGIVVISGTGSIVLGIHNQESARAGGWGYKLGDEGSAYWIGMRGIKAVLDAYDGVSLSTDLTEVILNHFSLDNPEDFIELFYKKNISKNMIAEVSKLVDTVALNGDVVAIKILETSSQALGKQVVGVYKRLFNKEKSKIPVILNGSVVLNSSIFSKALVKYLESKTIHLKVQSINRDPSFGACKFAKEMK
ncbi:MAG TPA: BadF/BadG/BcrA/BcrD ATPase family protein [Clostridia bacterium]|nr:BadF/BadG/BcrA/BcrD ATPase family protein [Clostridia bacterium]